MSMQFNYMFPKPDMALSNWKSSRQDLSVPLGSQHNKFCCFFSMAVELITQDTTACMRVPSWHVKDYYKTVTEAGSIAEAQDSNLLKCYTVSTDE